METVMVSPTHEPLYSTLADDEDMVELIEMFVLDAHLKATRLESCLNSEDWEELRRSAHQIKGAAGGYGFDKLTPCAQRLETCLQDPSDNADIKANVEELAALLRSLETM